MALGDCGADCLVVQVSSVDPTFLRLWLIMLRPSFLVKDAQQDLAGERLKA